jgi:hypothetical protein
MNHSTLQKGMLHTAAEGLGLVSLINSLTSGKKVSTSQKGLRSTGGPDLLKWGLPGGGVKSAKVAPTPYVYYPRVRYAGTDYGKNNL